MLKSLKLKIERYKDYRRNRGNYEQFGMYLNNDKTFLPSIHVVKQNNIHSYRDKFKTEVLVETGTYMGDMVEAQKKYFKTVYSIELSVELHQKAVERFKNDSNVKILQGDSSVVLKDILKALKTPALFWLDGHYSGDITAKGEKETPILAELEQVLRNNDRHIILIDDARLFIGENDYPTIPDLCLFVHSINPEKDIIIADDIIRITPRGTIS